MISDGFPIEEPGDYVPDDDEDDEDLTSDYVYDELPVDDLGY